MVSKLIFHLHGYLSNHLDSHLLVSYFNSKSAAVVHPTLVVNRVLCISFISALHLTTGLDI